MALLVIQNFGGDVVGGSAFGLLPLTLISYLCSQAEIADLDL